VIAFHAEGSGVAIAIGLAAAFDQRVHLCHVSRKSEIGLIAEAKRRGLPVTCEVTPHHLFLTERDLPRLGTFGEMKPRLASPSDVEALWAHIDTVIDCVATDHAPHTIAEKESDDAPPGVPGLDTALPLMLTAVAEGRLTLERVVELMATNPRRIFKLPKQPDTWIEVDTEDDYILSQQGLHSKCGWSPFLGTRLRGRVHRVQFRGRPVVRNGEIRAPFVR
jgi:carbamoyl-phosphate synthase/aspartate carbamoyltransferase/dihydroorotase